MCAYMQCLINHKNKNGSILVSIKKKIDIQISVILFLYFGQFPQEVQ